VEGMDKDYCHRLQCYPVISKQVPVPIDVCLERVLGWGYR
jgi:hypothetical protein